MTTENIEINIREDGSRVAVVNITAIANASANAGRQVDFLQQAFRRLAVVATIKALVEMADQVTLLEARLKLATKTTQDFNKAQEDIYRMSQTNNVGLAETTKLYTRLAEPVKKLGGGLNEVTAIVDAFSTALRVGGATTSEAAAATLQFSQALNKGKLDGDEFKTLAETAPRVMRAFADGMGVASGELKTMASQGKLTSDVIGNALIKELGNLKAEAAGLKNTVGGAFSDLTNDVLISVGAFDKMTGTTSMMADVIQGASYLVFQLGKVFKDEAADGSKVAMDQFSAMTPIIKGLGLVFETLLLLGSDIAFIFRSIGREIGGIAAQITALMNRDWSGIGRIREEMIADAKKDFEELQRFQNRIAGITDKAMEQRNVAHSGKSSVDNTDYATLKTVTNEKDLVAVRMRLTGITKSYFNDLNTLQGAYESGNLSQKEYIGLMSELATKTYEASKAGRDAKKGMVGNDDRMKIMQDNLVKSQTMFEKEESIFEARNRMLELYHSKFNMSDTDFYAGRETARKEFLAAEQSSFEREKSMILAFKPKNNNEEADQQLRLSRLLKQHEDFNNKMAGLRTDDLLDRMTKNKEIQDASDDGVNKYLSSQYETLEGLKKTNEARERSKAAVERETVAIYEQAVANMRLQASLPVGINGRTQEDQDHAIAMVNFLQTELDMRKGITAELEKQDALKNQNKAFANMIRDWKEGSKDIADSLKNTFGTVGNAFGDMIKSFAEGVTDHMVIMKRMQDATKGMDDNDPRKIDAIKKANMDSARAQIKSYGDMAGAAKGFFKENSKGYKVLETTEKAFRAFEMALALESMVKKIFFKETEVAANTTLNATKVAGEATASAASTGLAATEASAWGITAVVKAIASLPFPANLAAGAATLAAVVAIGAKLFGSMNSGAATISETRQKANGTGSVLGDKDAKSESIKNAIELAAANSNIELTHTAGMLRALLSIENSIGNVGDVLARGGDINTVAPASKMGSFATGAAKVMTFDPFSQLFDKITNGWVSKTTGQIVNAIFGGKVSTLDVGITAGKTSVGGVMNGGFNAQSYQDTKKDGGWFRSDKYSTNTQGLSAEANQQFGEVIKGMADAVSEAADLLGLGGEQFKARLNSFVVDMGKISLKDLKPEEVQAALQAAFSKIGDDMARYAVGDLLKFQKAGEGYLETLVRVAANYANVQSVFESMGKSTITIRQAGVAATERLVTLAGGIDKLASNAASFAENFLTEAERTAPVAAYVATEMNKLGLGWVTTRDQFKQVALAIDTSTEAGARQYTAMMGLADAFAKTHAATVDLTKSEEAIADERRDLQNRLDELTLNAAQRRAKERATIDPSNQRLFDQVSLREDLTAAYEKESDALKNVVTQLGDFQKNVLSFRDSLALGAQSTMTPVEKAAEAERVYNETLAKARAGDKNAQSGITSAASAYLSATQAINASSEKQNDIFERVRADMAALAANAGIQLTDAQQQLDAMKQQVAGIITLNETMTSVRDLIAAIAQADRAPVSPYAYRENEQDIGASLVATLQDVVANTAKMLQDNAKIWEAINTQTEVVATATYDAADQNAEKVNSGAERIVRRQSWKYDNEEYVQ